MADNNNKTRVSVRVPINLSNPLWNNLVAGWKMDGDFNDVLGVANGTPINGAGFTTGKINQGFLGNGEITDSTAKYIDFGNSISQRNLNFPITISTWINKQYLNTGGCRLIFLDGELGNTSVSGAWLQVTNLNNTTDKLSRIRAGFGNGGSNISSNFKEYWTGFIVPNDVWSHIVVVINNDSDFKFYLNGVLVSSTLLNGTATNIGWSGKKTQIGANNNVGINNYSSTWPSFRGIMDETYIWNRALTQADITELYNSNAGKQYPN